MDIYRPVLGTLIVSFAALGMTTHHDSSNKSASLPDESGMNLSREDADLNHFVFEESKLAFGGSEAVARAVSHSILEESRRHNLDPLLIMSVIAHESRFNMTAIGSHGEVGLMQIRPSTAKWIAAKFKLPWSGWHSLVNPITNIRLGTAYLALLRDRHHAKKDRYLSAYNMGSINVKLALKNERTPHLYWDKVSQIYSNYQFEFGKIRQISKKMPFLVTASK